MLKVKLVTIAVFASISLLSQFVYADSIVDDAKITKIQNTSGNLDIFSVTVTGGTGPCADVQISFPRDAAGSQKIFDRAYVAALTAFAAGYKVNIYNYESNSCDRAVFIEIVQ